MKKGIIALTTVLTFMLCSVSAMAATYSFDYLFTGVASYNTDNYTFTNAPVNLTFDSDATNAFSMPDTSGGTSYFVPFGSTDYNGFSLSVDGTNLLDLMTFNYNTFAKIDLVGDALESVDISFNFAKVDVVEFVSAKMLLMMDPTMLSGFFEFTTSSQWTGETLAGIGAIDGTLSSPTPLPGAFLLFGTGLLGLAGLRRRFQA